MTADIIEAPDVVLVGSGIMSSTLAVTLKRLDPRLRVQIVEVASELARDCRAWTTACKPCGSTTPMPDAKNGGCLPATGGSVTIEIDGIGALTNPVIAEGE